MQNQHPCMQYGYQNGITSLAEDIRNKAISPDALLILKQEQSEDAVTLRTTPSEPSSDGGGTYEYINNSNDESKVFGQLNRNENNYCPGENTDIPDNIWSEDEHSESDMGDNALSEECGKFIVDNIPTIIIPKPPTDINDSGNSSSDSISELGSDMPTNNSRRHIFSNYWQRKDTASDSLSEHPSNRINRNSSSSQISRSDTSETISFPSSTTEKCHRKIKSKKYIMTDHLLNEEETPSRIKDSEDDEQRTKEQETTPLSSENQSNPLQPCILIHPRRRRKVIPDNCYGSTGESIPKISSTSALLHSQRANTKNQESCLRRTASALEPRSMKKCDGGGKVTFDSKVSIVEYDQQLFLRSSSGWSTRFM